MHEIGKLLVVLGLLIAVIGLVLIFAPRIPYLGRLPGDIAIERPNFRFYFPITTSLLISLILTLILWAISRR